MTDILNGNQICSNNNEAVYKHDMNSFLIVPYVQI